MFPSSFETMRTIGRPVLPWALAFALLLGLSAACSSDGDRRDRNYGTDAGAGYQLPDGGRRDSAATLDAPVVDVRMDISPEAADDVAADSAGTADAEPDAGSQTDAAGGADS
jgi:hypothetical protein